MSDAYKVEAFAFALAIVAWFGIMAIVLRGMGLI